MSLPIIVLIAVVVVVVAVLALRSGSQSDDSPQELPPPEPLRQEKPPAEKEDVAAGAVAPAPQESADSDSIGIVPEQTAETSAKISEPEASRTVHKASAEDIAAFRKGLKGTRQGFISRLSRLFVRERKIDPEILTEMEEVLITADIGVRTADGILEALRTSITEGRISDGEEAWSIVQEHTKDLLSRHGEGPIQIQHHPTVILVVGVNGVGKTTTIGKLASRFQEAGKEVLLAAGDTFRAAAVLQLEVWGRRADCNVIKGKDRADPSSVIFEAVQKGIETGVDVVIADTAGRLHTKTPLMEELKKVGRTIEKALGRPADEVLLVLDATTGQNAIQQTELFKGALPVSGIALTKLDGTAKGGVILGIVDQHHLPIRYVGVGERVEDLKEFESEGFIQALFERPDGPEAGDER